MKSIVNNYEEAMELAKEISEFEPISMEAIICMIIDTEASKYKEPAVDIVDRIWVLFKKSMKSWDPISQTRRERYDRKNTA